MIGFQSFRCIHGYRFLKAFNFLRGCNGMFVHVNTLNSSMPCTSNDSPLHSVNWSASFCNLSNNVSNFEKEKEMIKASRKTEAKNIENSSFLVDLVFNEEVDLPSKKELKNAEWHLDNWFFTLQAAKKSPKPLSLWHVVNKEQYQTIVSLSSRQGAPSVLMEKCIRLLLMEEDDHEFTPRLLTQISENSSHLPMKTLVNVVLMLAEAKQTELRISVRKELVAHAVNKRWYEINQRHIVTFMYQLDELFDLKSIHYDIRNIGRSIEATNGISSETTTNDNRSQVESSTPSMNVPVLSMNVDRCILNFADELKAKDLARILTLMGRWRNRNETLIAALIHRLNQADMSNFSYIQLANILLASSTLAIHNETLVEKVVQCLQSQDPISPSKTVSVMASLSYLKWYDPDFTSKNLTYLNDHIDKLTAKEAGSILMTLANFYVLPDSTEEKNVITALGNQALSDSLSAHDTVNIMWSLAVLLSLDKDKVSAVLETSFMQQFQESKSFKDLSSLQKLKQVNTAAKLEVKSYTGTLIPGNAIESGISEEITSIGSDLQSTLSNALSKFVNISSYVKFDERLPGGYLADALMCADADGSLRPLTHCEEESEKPVSFKLAIKIIPFSGVIIPQKTPSGVHQMESRHLRTMGYTPVSVLYSDLHGNKSSLEHVDAIRARIKASVQAVSHT